MSGDKEQKKTFFEILFGRSSQAEKGILDVELFGEEYVLVGDLESGGSIATREAFEDFEDSYAYLFEDGKIRRFGHVIGDVSDLTLID